MTNNKKKKKGRGVAAPALRTLPMTDDPREKWVEDTGTWEKLSQVKQQHLRRGVCHQVKEDVSCICPFIILSGD